MPAVIVYTHVGFLPSRLNIATDHSTHMSSSSPPNTGRMYTTSYMYKQDTCPLRAPVRPCVCLTEISLDYAKLIRHMHSCVTDCTSDLQSPSRIQIEIGAIFPPSFHLFPSTVLAEFHLNPLYQCFRSLPLLIENTMPVSSANLNQALACTLLISLYLISCFLIFISFRSAQLPTWKHLIYLYSSYTSLARPTPRPLPSPRHLSLNGVCGGVSRRARCSPCPSNTSDLPLPPE